MGEDPGATKNAAPEAREEVIQAPGQRNFLSADTEEVAARTVVRWASATDLLPRRMNH